MKKLGILLSSLMMLVFSFFIFSQDKDIREDVVVVNVEVPVRVMFKGKPVDNLKKSDFKLFENGKEQEINGFYMIRKKIKGQEYELSSDRTEKYKPRYFVLVFRIYSVTKPIEDSIKYFFEKIFRSEDKLLLFINNKTLYFNDVNNKKGIIEIIKKYMKSESLSAKFRFEKAYQKINSDLKRARFLSGLDMGNISNGDVRLDPLQKKRFLENYMAILKEYRKRFLTPDIGVYYNFANHLEKINIEKWVITFYQFEKFPTIKISGRLRRVLGSEINYIDRKIRMADDFPSEQIAKIFYKVNTTFHSLFFTTYENINSRDLELKAISTDLENSFREITKKTGGQLIVSNKLDLSLEKVVEKEDVYYMLTYSPEKSGNTGKIKVKLSNPGYQIYYDDNIRADYITDYLKKKESELSTIKLKNLVFKDRALSFDIEDIMKREIKGSAIGRVKMHLEIKDETGRSLFNKSRVMEVLKNRVHFSIGFKWLNRGNYDLMIDATDIFTGRSAFEYKKIEVK